MRHLTILCLFFVACKSPQIENRVEIDHAKNFIRMATDEDAYDLALQEYYKIDETREDYALLTNIKALMWARKTYSVDVSEMIKENIAKWHRIQR